MRRDRPRSSMMHATNINIIAMRHFPIICRLCFLLVFLFAGSGRVAMAASDPIVIGQLLNLGATDDGTAARVQGGTQAFLEAINASGGLHGHPLKLVTVINNSTDVKVLTQGYRSLIKENKVVALINCVGETYCQAAASVAAESKIPLIGVMTGTKQLSRANNPYIFRVRPGYEREASAIAKQLTAIGSFSVAIITDRAATSEEVSTLQQAFVKQNIKVSIITLSTTDAPARNAMLMTLGKGKFQAAIIDLRIETVNAITEAGEEKREEWPLTLMSTLDGPLSSMVNVFKSKVIGFSIAVPHPELANIQLTRELQSNAERYSGSGYAMTYPGLEGYINIKICAEAIRRAGSQPDAEHIAAALNSMEDYDLGGFNVSFAHGRESASDFIDVGVRARNGILLQ